MLTRRVANAGATAHYHLNPGVRDTETIRTFETPFDSVVGGVATALRDGCAVRSARDSADGPAGLDPEFCDAPPRAPRSYAVCPTPVRRISTREGFTMGKTAIVATTGFCTLDHDE